MADDGYTPRMKVRYREELLPKLQQELGLTNPMEVPRFEKVVVNMGVGDALKDARLLDAAVDDLTIITGQKPVITKARKSIAGFKLREGMPIGVKVTLRGERMWSRSRCRGSETSAGWTPKPSTGGATTPSGSPSSSSSPRSTTTRC